MTEEQRTEEQTEETAETTEEESESKEEETKQEEEEEEEKPKVDFASVEVSSLDVLQLFELNGITYSRRKIHNLGVTCVSIAGDERIILSPEVKVKPI